MRFGGHVIGAGATLQKIADYLHDRPLRESWRSTNRVGWQSPGESFVLPDRTLLRNGADMVLYEPDDGGASPLSLRENGDLESWKREVAGLANGNSRPVFVLSAAFAPPLLELLRGEGGGFHFWGESSSGKTTLLQLAGSVWGGGVPDGYIRTWRTTDNALEVVCLQHHSLMLCLDEISQVDAMRLGEIVYLIANGSPKSRQNRGGNLRPTASWKLQFLSSGEVSMAKTIGDGARAGQEVRFVDLKADAGFGLGIWEVAPTGAGKLSEAVKQAVQSNYGVAGRAFVQALLDHGPELVGRLERRLAKTFKAFDLPENSSGQVRRVARHFALCALAGEIATEWRILPFEAGYCEIACRRLFNEWRLDRGTDGNAEEQKVIAAVRKGIEAHERERFERIPTFDDGFEDKSRIRDRLGFVEYDKEGSPTFFLTSGGWSELTKGFDDKFAREVLRRRGYLRLGSRGNTVQKKIRGINFSVTAVSGDILDCPQLE